MSPLPESLKLRVRTVEILPRRGRAHRPARPAAGGALRAAARTWPEVADRITDMTVRGAPAIGVAAAGGLAPGRPRGRPQPPRRPRGLRGRARDRPPRPAGHAAHGRQPRWAIDEMRAAWQRRCAGAPAACAAGAARGAPSRSTTTTSSAAWRIGALRRRAVHVRRPHPHPLQRRRPGDGGLRHGARRHPRRVRGLHARRLGAGRRDAAVAAGRAPHGLGAVRSRASRTAHHRQHGRVLHAPAGRSDGVVVGADRIAANGDTANKIGTYTRVGARQGARRAVLRGGAALHGRPEHRRRRRHPDRGARRGRGDVVRAGAASRPRGRGRGTRPSTSPRHANITAIVTEAGVLREPYTESLAGACARGRCA